MKRAIFATFVFAALGFAQSQTDFSGNWKLNVGKSEYGMLPPPESRTDKIEQSKDGISDSVSAVNQQGKTEYVLKFTTDGKETATKAGGRDVKVTASWDGPALVVTTKLDFQGQEVVAKAKWTLCDDKSSMTQTVHLTSPMGEMDQKVVFEKQ